MNKPDIDFDSFSKEILAAVRPIEGYLTDQEIVFLAMTALYPTTEGVVLEIGSFKGRSTVVLAKSIREISPREKIVAVDPLTSPSYTDPDLKGAKSSYDDFVANLKNAGVENNVEFHQMFSSELARIWDRKIRLLWIDGDHTYMGARNDLELFLPHLSNGAIVAFHDLLRLFEGPNRVFAENILLSEHFGAFGFCRSIGWAQYFEDPKMNQDFRKDKLKYYRKLSRLIPYSALKSPLLLSRMEKLKFKLFRAMIPHPPLTPSQWLRELTSSD